MQTPHSTEHYGLLRVVAAFLVFAGHQQALTGRAEPAFLGIVTWGELAVSIFFSLSGYLVAESWRRDPSPQRYFLRRGLRLIPGLAGVSLFCALVLGPATSSLSLGDYLTDPKTYAYLQNVVFRIRFELPGVFPTNPVPGVVNGSLWTLPMEVACYLLLVLFLRPTARLHRGWPVWLLAVSLWVVDMQVSSSARWILYSTNWRIGLHFASFFFVGAALRLAPPPRYQPVAAALLAAVAWMFFSQSPLGYWSAPLCVTLIVIGSARVSATPSRWVSRYGDLSYGLYLFAFPVQQAVVASGLFAGSPRRVFTVAWLGTVLCAWLSWHFIEAPALRFKPRRSESTNTPPDASAEGRHEASERP